MLMAGMMPKTAEDLRYMIVFEVVWSCLSKFIEVIPRAESLQEFQSGTSRVQLSMDRFCWLSISEYFLNSNPEVTR